MGNRGGPWLEILLSIDFAMVTHDYPQTPDGRYFVVRGRLWRLSNPALSADERQEWVVALMQARRAVKLAAGDTAGIARARKAVLRAKVALGERGPVWWTDGAPDYDQHLVGNTPYAGWFEGVLVSTREPGAVSAMTELQIETEMLASLAHRDEDSSLCPSEIARLLAPGKKEAWLQLMPRIRNAAARLMREDRVVVTRGSRVLPADDFGGGPIRIRRGPRFDGGRDR